MRTCLANKIISGRRHFSKVISDIFIVFFINFSFYFCLESVTIPNLRAFFSGDKIMVFGPPDKIVLIPWVEYPLQLPDHEREAWRNSMVLNGEKSIGNSKSCLAASTIKWMEKWLDFMGKPFFVFRFFLFKFLPILTLFSSGKWLKPKNGG